MKQQTAVEWLVNEIAEKYNFRFATYYGQEIQQAKAMFQQQIIDAYKVDVDEYPTQLSERAEQYYNQTFKKD
jgi:uncharacterized protein YycO